MNTLDTKEKIAFIINPVSGTTQKCDIPRLIQENIDHHKFETAILFTKSAGHATTLTKEYVADGYSRIIAVGGDGTVNEVAKALIGTNAALGIIPCGSGNGLGRTLQIPLKMKAAIELQNHGVVSQMDCGTINNEPFFCTCGVGFDAHIGKKFAEATSRGFWTYFKETIKSYFNYKAKKYKVKVDGVKVSSRAFLITVANAGQYGNDAYIAPLADIRDGELDVSIMSPFPIHRVLGIGFHIFNRSIHRSNYLQAMKGKSITIKRKKEGEVHLDGEPAIMGKKLKIKIIEKALNIIVKK